MKSLEIFEKALPTLKANLEILDSAFDGENKEVGLFVFANTSMQFFNFLHYLVKESTHEYKGWLKKASPFSDETEKTFSKPYLTLYANLYRARKDFQKLSEIMERPLKKYRDSIIKHYRAGVQVPEGVTLVLTEIVVDEKMHRGYTRKDLKIEVEV